VFSKFNEQPHFIIANQSSKGWKRKESKEKRKERKKEKIK
jgi:hypothetical protein